MNKRFLPFYLIIFSFGFFLVFSSFSIAELAVVDTNFPTTNNAAISKTETLLISLLSRDLSLNLKGDDVRLLQTWLIKSGDFPSSIIANGYFGPATQKAVQAYQKKNKIILSGTLATTGYGRVNVITRASLNSQFGDKMEGVSWVLGKYGAGVSLNGGYIEILSNPKLNLTYKDDVILDAWINPSTLLKTKEMIFARGNHYGLGITDGGKIFVRQNGVDVISAKKYIKTNKWQHISATFSSGKIVFKYNDKQVEVKKFKAKIITPGDDSLLVGLSFDSKKGLAEAYIGAVDNIYIYTVPNKELAPLPQMRLNLDDAQGVETTSMTGIFHGNLKVAIFDSELLKTKIPETKVPELVPVKIILTSESPFSKVVQSAINTVQNIVQQFTGGGGGGSSTPTVETPAPIVNNGTPPDPNYPMPPHGQEIVYGVSSGAGTIITFPTVDINPLVVYPGDTQTLKVIVTSTAGTISSVQAVTQLDTSTKTLNLVNDGTGTNTWTVSWTVSDTHVNIYRTNFTAIDSVGNSGSIPFAWSDPCTGLNASGNSTLTQTSCTPATIDGVDSGNITIGNGSAPTNLLLGSGSTFILTPGYSMIKAAQGSVSIPKGVGTTMTKGYLFYAGSGSYATSTATKTWASTPTAANSVRIVDTLGTYCPGTIAPGTTRAGFSASTVSCGVLCSTVAQTQTCQTDGTWNGSGITSCSVNSCGCSNYVVGGACTTTNACGSASGTWQDACTGNCSGNPTNSRTGYTASSVACGDSCSSIQQAQTCSNGSWSGSGITSCSVNSCGCSNYVVGGACTTTNACGSASGTWQDACTGDCSGNPTASRTRYSASTSGCGTYSCGSEAQTCSGGSWSGSYTGTSCAVAESGRYVSNSVSCGDTCDNYLNLAVYQCQSNGTYGGYASCSPAAGAYTVGAACNVNACGTAGGTIDNACTGHCSGSTPGTPYTSGGPCNRNSCGGSGTTTDACTGECSAVAPNIMYCGADYRCQAYGPPYCCNSTWGDAEC